MRVDPPWIAVAMPDGPIAATVEFELLQRTIFVRSLVVRSEKVPMAVKCCDWPGAAVRLAGVTARERSARVRTTIRSPKLRSTPSLTVRRMTYGPSASATKLGWAESASDKSAWLPAGAEIIHQLYVSGSPLGSKEALPSRNTVAV